jgi:hypothetical protein
MSALVNLQGPIDYLVMGKESLREGSFEESLKNG